jgi:hypothetical protein
MQFAGQKLKLCHTNILQNSTVRQAMDQGRQAAETRRLAIRRGRSRSFNQYAVIENTNSESALKTENKGDVGPVECPTVVIGR